MKLDLKRPFRNLFRIRFLRLKLNFMGAKYERESAEQVNPIKFVCRNHKQTRRNPDKCESRLAFSVVNDARESVPVDRLINYTLHSCS